MAQTVAVTPKIEPHCGRVLGSPYTRDPDVAVTPKIEPHCGIVLLILSGIQLKSQSHLKLNLTAGVALTSCDPADTVAVTPKIEPHCGDKEYIDKMVLNVAVTPKIEPHCGLSSGTLSAAE